MSEVLRVLAAYSSGESMTAREVANATSIDIQRVSTRANLLLERKDLERTSSGRPVQMRITQAGHDRLKATGIDFESLASVAMVQRAIRSRPALAIAWRVAA